MARKKKTLEEQRAEKLRKDQYWMRIYNNKLKKKASEVNKILNGKNVVSVVNEENRYTVKFKNGQTAKFKIWFPALFGERNIVPVLEE